MKIIITTILIVATISLFIAFNRKDEVYSDTVLLIDVTDSLAVPKADEVMPILLPDNIWNGANFSLSTISDLNINKTYQAKIEPANKWNGSEKLRKKEIKKFNSDVSGIIAEITKGQSDKDNSAVYIAISSALNQLAKSKARTRTLLIFSNLLDNTHSLSFYRKKDLNLLLSNPEVIAQKFEKISPLPDLSGISVIIVHQPKSIRDSELFSSLSVFYRSILEKHNAQVKITANI